MSRAVIYARYSSHNQTEQSIEGQLRECTEFAERKGYTIIDTYCDQAISGTTDNRPRFQQMIEDSKQKQFDIIIVWKIDRFSRDKYDSVVYKKKLRDNGVAVVSATEPIDDSPEGQLMESLFEGWSAYFVKDLAQKVNRGMTQNLLKGKWNGGTLTFGFYVDEDKHYQVDEPNAAIVREIFERYASGEMIKTIAEELNAKGVKNLKNNPITHHFIAHMLKNRRYIGEERFKETVIENAFEPIVPRDLFDRCQKRLESNKRISAHFAKNTVNYILTGKIFCGKCGSQLAGESGTSKTKKKHYYYKCQTAKKTKTCDKKPVRKAEIEEIVINYCFALLQDKALIDRIVDKVFELQSRENSTIPQLKIRLAEVEKQIENMVNAIAQGVVTKSTKDKLSALETEQESLQISITTESIKRPTYSKEDIKLWITKFAKIQEQDHKKLIDVFINSIYLYDDKMVIFFNYKDGEKLIDFAEVSEMKNTNFDKNQSSYLKGFGSPCENRTHN